MLPLSVELLTMCIAVQFQCMLAECPRLCASRTSQWTSVLLMAHREDCCIGILPKRRVNAKHCQLTVKMFLSDSVRKAPCRKRS